MSRLEVQQELDALLERISFKNPPFPMRLEGWVDEIGCHIRLHVRVLDRDTGKPLPVVHGTLISNLDIAARDEALLDIIRRHVHEAMRHEADEALHVDGERRWDPHTRKSS